MDDDKRYNGGKLDIWYNGFKLDGDITKITVRDLPKHEGDEFIPGLRDGTMQFTFAPVENNVVNIDAQIPTNLGKFVHTLVKALDDVLTANSKPVKIVASATLIEGILGEMYPQLIDNPVLDQVEGIEGEFHGVPFTLGQFEDGVLGQITTDRLEVIYIKAE